jgi:hypothetical protein
MEFRQKIATRTDSPTGASLRRMRRAIVAAPIVAAAIFFALADLDGAVHAGDAAATAAQISDGAFAMLNAVNGTDASKSGPVAIFAGDAHSLSDSVAAGDRAGTASNLAALEGDRSGVDSVVSSNPGLLNASDWNRIKSEMASLSKQLGATAAPPSAAAAPASTAVPSVHPVSAARPETSAPASTRASAGASGTPSMPGSAGASGTAPATGSDSAGAPPQVVIESRTPQGTAIHVKGYLEGSGLKRGGIYAGSHELRDFKVGGSGGEVRLNFDIGVESPKPDETIRVYDAAGRMAEARIAPIDVASTTPDLSAPPAAPDTSDNAPEIPALPPAAAVASKHAPSIEDGVEVYRNSTAKNDDDSGVPNTAEIPSHGAPLPSPSKRHTIGGHLGNVRINVSAVNQIGSTPPTFEIVGQIVGHGITRAGIYLGGRLARPITVEFGDDATSFDEKFTANGDEARIRAYGVGDQFVESSVDLSTATAVASADAPTNSGAMPPGATYGDPAVMGSSGLLVQIAAVGPITSNLYVVSGVISGAHLSAAGLYQNGMLVQRIPIGSGGIGGVISSLIPGSSHNVNFNVRFNPQAGPATIRAFDSSGGYNEQPIILAGGNPYGGVNPNGANPYGNSYGSSSYGSPYGSYGSGIGPPIGSARTNPYAGGSFGPPPINPLAPVNPFGSPPASSSW